MQGIQYRVVNSLFYLIDGRAIRSRLYVPSMKISYISCPVQKTAVMRSVTGLRDDCCVSRLLLPKTVSLEYVRLKNDKIDTSKVPALCEDDLEEWFVKGSGPGGQNVNKRTNCCTLRHKPTGILVKCHLSRELDKNRKLARKMLIEKLDGHYNGEDSVKSQKERLLLRKSQNAEQKSRKVSDLKKKYKDMLQENSENDSEASVK